MERKKFLFASIDGLINDMADGFVPKTDNRKNEIEGADIIIFDDVLGHGTKAQKGFMDMKGILYLEKVLFPSFRIMMTCGFRKSFLKQRLKNRITR